MISKTDAVWRKISWDAIHLMMDYLLNEVRPVGVELFGSPTMSRSITPDLHVLDRGNNIISIADSVVSGIGIPRLILHADVCP